MKYTHILWDYNGTILDDVDAGIASVNKLLRDRKLKTLDSVDEYHAVFTFPVINYYKKLGFDFERESFDIIAELWIAEYSEQLKKCTLRDGVREMLSELSQKGLRQSVISAADDSMLKAQLSSYGITHFFDEICGIEGIKAESKLHIARSWREKHPDAAALFIGDTLHDLDTARAASADCVLVCGGHQSEADLMSAGVPVVKTINDIINYL